MRPSGSTEPQASAVTIPGTLTGTGLTARFATGGWLPDTVTEADAVPVPPFVSVTVTDAVQLPTSYVWLARGELCGPAMAPSPKSKAYETMPPSESPEAEASALTASASLPLAGVIMSAAVGGVFVATDTVAVS